MGNENKQPITANVISDHPEIFAIVLGCVDSRLHRTVSSFGRVLVEQHICEDAELIGEHIDHLKLAGGVRVLTETNPYKKFVVDQIKTLIELHKPKVIVLSGHSDCGAYKHAGVPENTNWRTVLGNDLDNAKQTLEKAGVTVPIIKCGIFHETDTLEVFD